MPRPKLTEQERLARRRLRLVTPETAHKVLGKDIYWKVEFLDLYLERCDEIAFDDPQAGHQLAVHAPLLSDRIRVGNDPGDYPTEKHKRSSRVHALAVMAGTYRRIGKWSEALAHYQTAFALMESGTVYPRAQAELLWRFGTLKANLREPDARGHFNRALELFRSADDKTGAAQTLTQRAHWYWSCQDLAAAAEDLAAAMELVAGSRDERSKRTAIAAVGNLGWLASSGLSFQESTTALKLVETARKKTSNEPLSVVKAKLYWIEGSLNRSIYFFRPAIRLLRRAREGFRQLRLPYEFGICSLELAVALLDENRLADLDRIRADTISTVVELNPDPLLLEVLKRWSVETRQAGLLEIKQAAHEVVS